MASVDVDIVGYCYTISTNIFYVIYMASADVHSYAVDRFITYQIPNVDRLLHIFQDAGFVTHG